jgi:salicylate hydroxylase
VLGRELIAQPSGFSAYRCLIPREKVIHNPTIKKLLDGDETGMGFSTFMGKDRRLVAYPCRGGTLLNIVAIVPDETVDGQATEQWHAKSDMNKLIETYDEFCEDAKDILRAAESCVLWQLRDAEPRRSAS